MSTLSLDQIHPAARSALVLGLFLQLLRYRPA